MSRRPKLEQKTSKARQGKAGQDNTRQASQAKAEQNKSKASNPSSGPLLKTKKQTTETAVAIQLQQPLQRPPIIHYAQECPPIIPPRAGSSTYHPLRAGASTYHPLRARASTYHPLRAGTKKKKRKNKTRSSLLRRGAILAQHRPQARGYKLSPEL